MATDTLAQHEVEEQSGAWDGGTQPFRASYGKLMMWYFLLSDAFTFAGFLIAYGALRFSTPTWPVPDFVFSTAPLGIHNLFPGDKAPLIFVTFMSFLLIISSGTMVRAVQEGHRENKNGVVFWMLLTVLGGLGFLGCQAWEWTNLIGTEGMTIYNNPFSSHTEDGKYLSLDELAAQPGFEKHSHVAHGEEVVYFTDANGKEYFEKVDHHGHSYAGETFTEGTPYLITVHDGHYQPGAYITESEGGKSVIKMEEKGPKTFGALFFGITGFHGFHVFSGVVFLLIILINAASGLYAKRRNGYEMVEKIGLYWHFVDLVWVFVFLVFYLL